MFFLHLMYVQFASNCYKKIIKGISSIFGYFNMPHNIPSLGLSHFYVFITFNVTCFCPAEFHLLLNDQQNVMM
jgi:hypothetical protein